MAAASFGDLTTAVDTVLLWHPSPSPASTSVVQCASKMIRVAAMTPPWEACGGGRLQARRDEVRRRTRPFDGPALRAGTSRRLGRSNDLRDLSMLQACVVQRVTSARELVFQLPDAVTASLGAIAAIPVRDEQDRIESCLDALLPSVISPEGPSHQAPSDSFCSSTTVAIAPRRSHVGVSLPAARPSPW